MRYSLRCGRIIEYNGINYAIKISSYGNVSDFAIAFYSASKLNLTIDQIRKIIYDIFKVDLYLQSDHYLTSRRSYGFYATSNAYQIVYETYNKMKKCYIYGDKLIHNRHLNAFKNIRVYKNDEDLVKRLLWNMNNEASIFFNGKITLKEKLRTDILNSLFICNYVGLFINDTDIG